MEFVESQLVFLSRHLDRLRYDVRELIFEPPASLETVKQLEEELGYNLPPSFRDALLTISAHVEFRWFAPKETTYPEPFESNFGGDLHWSIELTKVFGAEWQEALKSLFPNQSNPYDAVWHDKLTFYEVGNGDYLAMDLRPESYEQIVYLSHDGSNANGHVLADDFTDLLKRWLPLACTGGEDWQWLPFTNSETTPIDPDGPAGHAWRKLLRL